MEIQVTNACYASKATELHLKQLIRNRLNNSHGSRSEPDASGDQVPRLVAMARIPQPRNKCCLGADGDKA